MSIKLATVKANTRMKTKYVPIISGSLGALVPLGIVSIDRLSWGGWWANWIIYVWPTSYMMVATSAMIDRFWYAMLAFATIINALLYAIAGTMSVDRLVTYHHYIALLLVICAEVAGCKRQESPPNWSVDALNQPYMGHAVTTIPDDSELTHPEYSKVLAASLRMLNIVDPTKDLDANLSRGNDRFVGKYGYSCSPPGLDENAKGNSFTADQRLEISHGVKCIEGTSDVIPDDPQYRDLFETAWKYARTYNTEYLRRIRKGRVN